MTPARTSKPGTATDEFDDPYVDVDEMQNGGAAHRYVHGGFRGTGTKFSIHLPSSDDYEGRFFQYIAPVPDSEHFSEGLTGEEDKIGFALKSGAIFL